MSGHLLSVENVTRSYALGGLFGRGHFNAVENVSFSIPNGRPEIFTIVGESGSGKSTLAKMILNLAVPTSGHIRLRGTDVTHARDRRGRLAFMAAVQPIFQNPFEAFSPLKRVDAYLLKTARTFAGAKSETDAQAAADHALRNVGLTFAEIERRFPHELSGGQIQRVAIARALIPKPALIVADEPVSMVDASLRMSIVNLFKALRDDLGVSIIYITHDLATAYYISDHIIVMQTGRVVEGGDARHVLDAPQHPYTQRLKASVLAVNTLDPSNTLRA
jgi:ABC-type glutathione transport system ATPase component